jgi:hypothetical protein
MGFFREPQSLLVFIVFTTSCAGTQIVLYSDNITNVREQRGLIFSTALALFKFTVSLVACYAAEII